MIFDGIHNVNGLMSYWVNRLMGNYLTLNASQPHQLINSSTHQPINSLTHLPIYPSTEV